MGYESKKLATIEFITDFETPMYHLGEVQGSFDEKQLKDYVKRFKADDLLFCLAYLQFQVVNAIREVNAELSEVNVSCNVTKKPPQLPPPPQHRIIKEGGYVKPPPKISITRRTEENV